MNNATMYHSVNVDGFKIFYREAGKANKSKLLLLHGFPSAGHMFRDLIPLLSDRFHIVAPDLPGFGQSDMPTHDKFKYTFDNIAKVIERFTEVIGFDRFAVYVFDYGAPTGFRLAVRHPERITGIISQNGNGYEEGLSDGWTPIKTYWENPSQANREALRTFLSPQTTHWQYTHGVKDEAAVSPDGQNLDIDRGGSRRAVCPERAAPIPDQSQECARGTRSHPADGCRPPPGASQEFPRCRSSETLRTDLAAHRGEPNGIGGTRAHHRRHNCESRGTPSRIARHRQRSEIRSDSWRFIRKARTKIRTRKVHGVCRQ